MYRAPKFEQVLKRRVSIPFTAQLAAGASQCYSAGPITWRFKVLEVEMVFAPNCYDRLQLYWYFSRMRHTDAGQPTGERNIFSYLAGNQYFVGTGLIKRVECYVQNETEERYITLWANNTGVDPLTVNATITIEEA